MDTLLNLGGPRQRPRTTVQFGEVAVEVRDLTRGERRQIDRLFPVPIAPLGPDPTKGSLASDPIARTDDPRYRLAFAERWSKSRPTEIAIATGWADAAGRQWPALTTDEERLRWAGEAARFIDMLDDGEVGRIEDAMAALSTGPGGLQEAPGKG